MDTKKELEAIYVEMPISIEQKKEYNRLGYRVVDAHFAPEGYELPDGLTPIKQGEETDTERKARIAAERKAKKEAALAKKEQDQEGHGLE